MVFTPRTCAPKPTTESAEASTRTCRAAGPAHGGPRRVGNQAALRLRSQSAAAPGLALQLHSDPSAPPDLDLSQLPAASGGGEPIPDDGEAIATLDPGSAEPPQEEEGAAVQASFDGRSPPPRAPAEQIAAGLGAGKPLPAGLGARMGSFFGFDFGGVRVHDDAHADTLVRSLGAHAVTVGGHVAFARGRFRPESREGQRLLAHELTHVTQQSRGLGEDVLRSGIGTPGDRYEREADSQAQRFVDGAAAGPRGAAGGARGAALQLYSGTAAATYASVFAKDSNQDYPRFGNDCTNFVSQALLAGGWAMAGGSCSDRTSDSAWWYGGSKCWYPTVRASYTWAGAQNLYNFMSGSGRGTAAARVSELDIGDVLQMAFSGTHIHHTMIVTDKKGGNLYLSYHTEDHLDRPFWGTDGILDAYPSAKYYGWRL